MSRGTGDGRREEIEGVEGYETQELASEPSSGEPEIPPFAGITAVRGFAGGMDRRRNGVMAASYVMEDREVREDREGYET